MTTEYRFDLSFKDYLAILFRRNKRCLNCNSPVTRKIDKADHGKGWDANVHGHSVDIGHKHKYTVNLKYVCEVCNNSYLPREFW